jgi:hypothetical protein
MSHASHSRHRTSALNAFLLVGTVEREGHDLTVTLDQDGGLPEI